MVQVRQQGRGGQQAVSGAVPPSQYNSCGWVGDLAAPEVGHGCRRAGASSEELGLAGRKSALAVLLHYASSEQWPSRMTSSRSSCSNSPVAYCTLQDRGTEGCTARGGAGGQGGMQADAAQAVGEAAAHAGARLAACQGLAQNDASDSLPTTVKSRCMEKAGKPAAVAAPSLCLA